jgi:PPOX class probable F420-dependent enzyme
MPSRRAQITMTPEEVDAFLGGRRTMNVATIGPSGHPHVVAMWYGFHEGAPAFWTFGRSQKIVNLRRDPKLSALVEDGEIYAELKGVELVGTGRIVEDRDEIIAIGLSVATRYQDVDAESARPFVEAQAGKRIGVVIDVEHTVTWDHTKLGGGY